MNIKFSKTVFSVSTSKWMFCAGKVFQDGFGFILYPFEGKVQLMKIPIFEKFW